MRKIDFTVTEEFDSSTVQIFLRAKQKVSLRLIRSLKRVPNGIEKNGEKARTIDVIHTGDTVTLNIPDEETEIAECNCELDVVYEDDDVIVVNKEAMMPIHESHNHQGDTLQNAVVSYLSKKGKKVSFRAVGRLDKGTSGLVVCALNQHAAAWLSGKVKKEYLAIPTGEYIEDGTIDRPIFRPDSMKTIRIVDDRGDKAVTHYTVIKSSPKLSLLRVHLETGRTHQIRVHFAHLGTPLFGDRMYGEETEEIEHQCLHCAYAEFVHPITGEKIVCEAPMDADMAKIADRI